MRYNVYYRGIALCDYYRGIALCDYYRGIALCDYYRGIALCWSICKVLTWLYLIRMVVMHVRPIYNLALNKITPQPCISRHFNAGNVNDVKQGGILTYTVSSILFIVYSDEFVLLLIN